MTWLLDADILSQPATRHGDARVIAWLEQEKPRCYTSAVVIANWLSGCAARKVDSARRFKPGSHN